MMLALAACSSPRDRRNRDDACLPLPGAIRRGLVADPAGGALYWIEDVSTADYDAELQIQARLVRYDLAARRLDVIADWVAAPFHFMRGGIVVRQASDGAWRLVRIPHTGRIEVLTPSHLSVYDAEPVDPGMLVVRAGGDGMSAIYTLQLHRPRAALLAKADILLGVAAGQAVIERDDAHFAIDLETGAERPLELPDGATPNRDEAWFVAENTVRLHVMSTGEVQTGETTYHYDGKALTVADQ
ncbi:MAG: hypothetical protein H0T89_30290 [Deltaproteobacteria bacterium]|nr:hypothetical protein [Deltaproteobacteria bacterium]MDQ3300296.1 hypothetical protein [Myxococcota bacterium]